MREKSVWNFDISLYYISFRLKKLNGFLMGIIWFFKIVKVKKFKNLEILSKTLILSPKIEVKTKIYETGGFFKWYPIRTF